MKTKIFAILLSILSIININSQEIQKIWTGTHNSTVTSVDFLPDGRLLSSSYDGTVKLWTTNGVGSVIYNSPSINGVVTIESVSTDGATIAVGLKNGTVQILGGNSWNIGAGVKSVSVYNGSVAAVGENNLVYLNDTPVASSSAGNYSVYNCAQGLVWGGIDRYVRTSWDYYYQDTDWILGVDYFNGKIVSVGASPYVRVNGQAVFVLPEKGASSININRVNGKLLVSDWVLNIHIMTDAGVSEKKFKEVALVRSVKWSPDGSKIGYGTADGRVVLALPEYTSSSTSTNPPVVIPPKKGKGRK